MCLLLLIMLVVDRILHYLIGIVYKHSLLDMDIKDTQDIFAVRK